MMPRSNTSNSHPDVSIARGAYSVHAGRAQIARWTGMMSACKTMALAAALAVGGSAEALAADPPPPDPAANRVWGGCVLNSAAVTALIQSIQGSGFQNPQVKVSFVIVYTQTNDNNGQPLSGAGSGFTGPVICRNSSEVGITALDKNRNPLQETTDIPTQIDPFGGTSVDIPNFAQGSVLQYFLNNGANAGKTENRICYGTDANVDCFRICSGNCFPP